MATKTVTLPITGMTCANCVATVERNLKKLDGVQSAAVNLASERAAVEYDRAKLGQTDLIARIERAGYGVAVGEAVLPLRRLGDETDARRLQKALAAREGVTEAVVNLATEQAVVKYIPTLVSQAELRQAAAAAGFETLAASGAAEDAEQAARDHEIARQRRLLTLGLLFTLPLFALSMSMDLIMNVAAFPNYLPWLFNWE